MNRSLLLVEHDPDQLDLLTRCLIHAGYQVVSVHHSRLPLEAASFRQFQVALLDASLPEMNAFELMRCFKRTQDHLQCVILSALRHPEWPQRRTMPPARGPVQHRAVGRNRRGCVEQCGSRNVCLRRGG